VERWHTGRRGSRSPLPALLLLPFLTPASVVPCARELGVGIVAYSPLCRGLLAGAIDPAALPVTDRRSLNPRFTAENFSANKAGCAEPLAQMAGNALCATHGRLARSTSLCCCSATKGCTAAQLSLAWVHAQGDDVFPIPGTKSVSRLLEASAMPARGRARASALLTPCDIRTCRRLPSSFRQKRSSSCEGACRS
jgi:aryl-alcohol dehydrogenase-like predicted oxidoreductase